jgi:putative cell wall-binding protein
VASGDNYPDALSVAPVAAKQGVPLLLVTRDSIPPSVLTELTRLHPQRIVAVGGTAAVSDAVLQQLNGYAPTTRLQGTDRYNTSIQVGAVLGANRSGKVYLATGANFPDALSAAAAAGYQDAPLLLVNGSTTVSSALASALISWGVTQVTIVGGTSVMTDQFAASVAAIPGVTSVPRVSGTDRYSTSVAVNSAAFPHPTGAFMAVGTAFPDAHSGGALAGKQGKPMYLVPGPCVSSGALGQLVAAGPISVALLGGTSALTQAAASFTPCS